MNKWTLIISLFILIIGGVLGWLLKPSPHPIVEVKETIVRDTIQVEKVIKIYEETEPVTITDTLGIGVQALADSIEGRKNDVEYKARYSFELGKKSVWDIQVKPLIKTVTEYITKDSIQTIVKAEYITKPFFLDSWFYAFLGTLGALIVSLFFGA